MIKALMPRLRKLGLATKVEFPESKNANDAWRYIEALRNDPEIWQWIGPERASPATQEVRGQRSEVRNFSGD
jgi:hypothetical protein